MSAGVAGTDETKQKENYIMSQLNYTQIEKALLERVPFKGSSCHAYFDGDQYRVVSYSTLIATSERGVYWVNPTKYSVTTSRLQNIIRKAWGI